MRKQVLALVLGLMTIVSFAQKKELKIAEKAIKKADFSSAMAAVNSVEATIANADDKLKAKFYFLKGQAAFGTNDYLGASKAFKALLTLEKNAKRKTYTSKVVIENQKLLQKVSTNGVDNFNANKFSEATKDFYLSFVISPKDTSYLYNAAISSSRAKDLNTSLEYFKKLISLGYAGMKTEYFATNVATGKEDPFAAKDLRDFSVKGKTHNNPIQRYTESKTASMIKDIASILAEQGKTDEAVIEIKKARKLDPSDLNLLLTEADFYIKLKRIDDFATLMKEAVKRDPTNPTLYYNLGVVSFTHSKKPLDAIGYYKKAIEIDPNYVDAYLNLSSAILSKERAIIEEMNNVSGNQDGAKRYKELEKQQLDVYKETLPFLEKADSLKRSIDTVKTLLNIYDILEMDAKSTEYRALYKSMK